MQFHRRLPGYQPTPLLEAPGIAAELGLARLWVKDESSRMGLPAFKIMGASWAVYRALRPAMSSRTGASLPDGRRSTSSRRLLDPLKPLTLACATDGNHGRAVARMAAWLGLPARILVPADMAPARIAAIAGEGAEVIVHDGSYDEAVARSAEEAGERTAGHLRHLLARLRGRPGLGHRGLLDDPLGDRGAVAALRERPNVVAAQIGVGAFASAVVRHVRRNGGWPGAFILGVEPSHAACAIASIEAGEIVEVPGPHDSIMSGLNCGIPSPLAWPVISAGIDAFIAIDDERTRTAMRALHREGIVAGECGAAGLAGLMTWQARFGGDLNGKHALVISTEGATDPDAYRHIVGG